MKKKRYFRTIDLSVDPHKEWDTSPSLAKDYLDLPKNTRHVLNDHMLELQHLTKRLAFLEQIFRDSYIMAFYHDQIQDLLKDREKKFRKHWILYQLPMRFAHHDVIDQVFQDMITGHFIKQHPRGWYEVI